jgi:hypothetical protein
MRLIQRDRVVQHLLTAIFVEGFRRRSALRVLTLSASLIVQGLSCVTSLQSPRPAGNRTDTPAIPAFPEDNARSLSGGAPADIAERENRVGAGAGSIEPFQVSGWRGARKAASYGFSMVLFG